MDGSRLTVGVPQERFPGETRVALTPPAIASLGPTLGAVVEEGAGERAGFSARKVVFVPGYGMAAARAQHKVQELAQLLERRGTEVTFAIHPVAGRMPGHMNVLLAQANVPYEKLRSHEEANSELPEADVALVIGANDVVNPAARHERESPIYGMPILDVDRAGCVMVIKRSMRTGYAGIENELFYLDRTMMLFGDGKEMAAEIAAEVAKTPGVVPAPPISVAVTGISVR